MVVRLSHGSSMEVFLATREVMPLVHEPVVVKQVHEPTAEDAEFARKFLAEAAVLRKLAHPHIVKILDAGVMDGRCFVAEEYLEGQPLRLLLRRSSAEENGLPVEVAAYVASCVLEGLHYAHEAKDEGGRSLQIVHGDVTPDNVFVTNEGGVKILNFRVGNADRRADVWSVGAVLWEALTSVSLFADEAGNSAGSEAQPRTSAPSSVRPSVPAALDAIVLRALAHDPRERYQSALEMRRDLDRWFASLGRRRDPAPLGSLMRRFFANEVAEQRRLVTVLSGGDDSAPSSRSARSTTLSSDSPPPKASSGAPSRPPPQSKSRPIPPPIPPIPPLPPPPSGRPPPARTSDPPPSSRVPPLPPASPSASGTAPVSRPPSAGAAPPVSRSPSASGTPPASRSPSASGTPPASRSPSASGTPVARGGGYRSSRTLGSAGLVPPDALALAERDPPSSDDEASTRRKRYGSLVVIALVCGGMSAAVTYLVVSSTRSRGASPAVAAVAAREIPDRRPRTVEPPPPSPESTNGPAEATSNVASEPPPTAVVETPSPPEGVPSARSVSTQTAPRTRVPHAPSASKPDEAPPSRSDEVPALASANPAPAAPPETGFLTVDTTPWSIVSERGKPLGQTPLVHVELSSGPHVLTLVNPELGVSTTYTVTIQPGKTVVKRIGLE
jgi:serine/threonine protein kinase